MARRGHLSVKPLPTELQAPVWLSAVALHECLEGAIGAPVDLILTDNRRSMIRIRRQEGGGFMARLHHMFTQADDEVVDALATLTRQPSEQEIGQARAVLRDFTSGNRELVRRKLPERRVRLRQQGRTHDLAGLAREVITTDFTEAEAQGLGVVEITWGRWGKPGQTVREIRLGSYDPRRRLIRIHPILDRSNVPDWVVRFVIFHELLHHVIPSRREQGRVTHHSAAFMAREARHPDYDAYVTWARDELIRMMGHEPDVASG